ncbi:unknown [Bacteroides sp. CAG:714]|nr:unknown [Bacteroides sp. CAG:714]
MSNFIKMKSAIFLYGFVIRRKLLMENYSRKIFKGLIGI